VIDDEDFNRAISRHQSEPKLLLYRGEKGRQVRFLFVVVGPLQREVKGSPDTCIILNECVQLAPQFPREFRERLVEGRYLASTRLETDLVPRVLREFRSAFRDHQRVPWPFPYFAMILQTKTVRQERLQQRA
jgi:hypothetical protein